MSRSARFACALALTASLAAAADAPPRAAGAASKVSARDRDRAEKAYQASLDLYRKGQYRAAIEKLEDARAIDPEAKELPYNLGLVHEKLGDADEAIDAYHRYLAVLGDDVDPEEKNKIESVIKRLEGAKAELKAREAKRMEHRFTPLSTSLAVGAGISIVATIVFGALAMKDDKNARDFTVGSGGSVADRNALIDRSKREAVLADVFGVVGIAAGGAAIALYFTSEFPRESRPEDSKPPPPVSGRLSMKPIAAGGAMMNVELAF